MTARQKAEFQLTQDKLCMPFQVFHEAIEATLGRPVYTHEFGLNYEGLGRELFQGGKPPTLRDIIAMIPDNKPVIAILKEDAKETP